MKIFKVTQTINASPETIWALLTDVPNWPDWNPTVTNVEGTIALNEKITVHAKISPNRAFPVMVSEFIPPERMVWSSNMPLGIFKGVRTFTLTQQPDGTVLFAMQEVFTGWLSFLITRFIPDLQPDFEKFALALKQRAEDG